MLLFRFTILNIFVLLVYKFSGTTSQILIEQRDSHKIEGFSQIFSKQNDPSEIEKSSQISQVTLTINGIHDYICENGAVQTLYCDINKGLYFDQPKKKKDKTTFNKYMYSYDNCIEIDGEDTKSHTYNYFLFLCAYKIHKIKFATKDGYVYTSTNQKIVNGKQSVKFTKEKIYITSDDIAIDNIPDYNTCDEENLPTKRLYCNSDRNFTFVRDHHINSYEICLPEKFKNFNSDRYDYNEAHISLKCDAHIQKIIINLNKYLCVYKIESPSDKSTDQSEEDTWRLSCEYQKFHFGIRQSLPSLYLLPIYIEEEGNVMCFDGYFHKDVEKYKVRYDESNLSKLKFTKTEDGQESTANEFPNCKRGCKFDPLKFISLGITINANREKRHAIIDCYYGRLNKNIPPINPECRTTAKDVYNWYWNGEIFDSFEDISCIRNLNTEIKTSTDEDEDINNNVQSSIPDQSNNIPKSESSTTQDQRTDSGTNTYIENLLDSNSVGRGINIPTDEDEEKKKTVQSSKPDQSNNIPKSESSTTQDQRTDSGTNTDIEKPLDSNSVEREKSVNKLPLIKEESQEEDKKTNLISPEDLHIFTPKKKSSDDKTTSAGIKNHPYYKWIIVSILIIVWN